MTLGVLVRLKASIQNTGYLSRSYFWKADGLVCEVRSGLDFVGATCLSTRSDQPRPLLSGASSVLTDGHWSMTVCLCGVEV